MSLGRYVAKWLERARKGAWLQVFIMVRGEWVWGRVCTHMGRDLKSLSLPSLPKERAPRLAYQLAQIKGTKEVRFQSCQQTSKKWSLTLHFGENLTYLYAFLKWVC